MKQDFGLESDSSYESLSSNGNPEFTTVLKAVTGRFAYGP